ncbi:MAG: class I SAM-dependent methyltransferase [Chloroflexi bacterium]|nr:class I SAM-dependent methyltransferase [Chloroflexota bacterium]
MFEMEEAHWWYVGMRAITASLLNGAGGVGKRVLDAGCGTGGMLAPLARYGRTVGLDMAGEALSYCRQRSQDALVCRGSVEALPFADASFDLVTSFEVLYHLRVGDDQQAVREFARVLRPGGFLLLRLPAYDSLRSKHDRAVHTRHRYRAPEVRRKVEGAGLAIERLSYANCLLFPAALVERLGEQVLWKQPSAEVSRGIVGGWLNGLFTGALALEARFLARGNLPFGLSVVCLARKPPSP